MCNSHQRIGGQTLDGPVMQSTNFLTRTTRTNLQDLPKNPVRQSVGGGGPGRDATNLGKEHPLIDKDLGIVKQVMLNTRGF